MSFPGNRSMLLAGTALLIALGGVMLGRTVLAPAPTAQSTGEAEADDHGPEGFVEMDAARATAAGIKTEAAALSALGAEILAQGSVAATPQGEALLTAHADGAVVRISKRLGDPVSAGEAVAYIESRDAASIAAERSAAGAKATAARLAYAREKRLFEAKVTARQDLEAAQAVLAEAEAEDRRTRSSAAAARVSGDGRFLAVTSLISGRITKADARLGAYVLAGTELFRVADPGRIQIEVAVPAADARRIKAGDPALIELAGGGTASATVRSATPSLDPASRTATIVLVPQGADGLTPGQGVRVRITPRGAPVGERIILPEEAVQTVAGRDVVFVRDGKGFQAIAVTIGARGGGRIEIARGLKPGALVVTRGAFLLKSELGKAEAEH